MSLFSQITQTIQRWLSQPVEELRRGQRALRYAIDVARVAAKAMSNHRVAILAAALTYRTIFALVPVAMLTLIVFRSFLDYSTALQTVKDNAYQLLNLNALTQGLSQTDATELQATLDHQIETFLNQAYHMDARQLGIAGGILLIWAVMALIVTVERCFDRIYDAPVGRPWHQRTMIYWAIITLGPILLVFSVYVARQIAANAADVPGVGPLLAFFGQFSGLLSTWLLLLLVYTMMPTAKVKLRPALAGSFVAALLWHLGQWGFGLYAGRAVGYSKVYGALSLIPLGLIWLQLSWLIVLFGFHITYSLQMVRGHQLRESQADRDDTIPLDPLSIITLMTCIANAFESGQAVDQPSLAQDMRLSTRLLARLLNLLERNGLIHTVQQNHEGDQENSYTLALPPQRIEVRRLIKLGREQTGNQRPSIADESPIIRQLIQAQYQAADDKTLADILQTETQ